MSVATTEMLTLRHLQEAVAGRAAAFRCRSRLQPAGGPGDKVFPPTYAGGVYAVEQRRVPVRRPDGTEGFETVTCVLLDSVQSQANRMEEALQEAFDAGWIQIPVIEVDFASFYPGDDKPEDLRLLDPIGKVTSLQAPHRVADAILRDSMFDGQAFRHSELGKRLDLAKTNNATPVYDLCPAALVFGMWDSTGPKGGLGVKFERTIVSEIVGIGCAYRFSGEEENTPRNRGIRRDPLGIRAAVRVKRTSPMTWKVADDPKAKGTSSPAEINHSNVPFETMNGGITIDYAEQTTVLSLACLRRLRFPPSGEGWKPTDDQHNRDNAARTVLAALGLCAAELAAEAGMDLRSRCLLWPDGPRRWELLERPGEQPKQFELGADRAIEVLKEAVAAAKAAGVTWQTEPIRLVPSDELVKLVRQSQRLEAQGAAEDGGGE